ncbi:DUF6010 family protein [Ferruginibacter paludis]|uniref:DUF6010 family protein n=1 Tax=Ferruginibacter paludis TaxID=1310417 RepID=UPI0025B29C0F|nr:DUF6010 family protein [Ferruginibacter paludis]MDN3654179.1 DUF6010 family protein [Ferruginibacter paludis]
MVATIIGVSSGLLIILLIGLLKQLDKKIIYGLALAGIGFLYVGFAWTNLQALIVNCAQAILFLFLAYYGIKKSLVLLAAGYLLHGCWDIAYHYFQNPGLIPPHYGLFCSSLDFSIAVYLLILNKRNLKMKAHN